MSDFQSQQLTQELYEKENLDDVGIYVPRRKDLEKVEGILKKSSGLVKDWFSQYGLGAITLPRNYIVDEMEPMYEDVPTRRGVVRLVAGIQGGKFEPDSLSIYLNSSFIEGTTGNERLINEYRRSLKLAEEIANDPYEKEDLREAFKRAIGFYKKGLNRLASGKEATYTVVHEILHLVLVAAFGIPLTESTGFLTVDNRPIVEGFNELATYAVTGEKGNPETTYGEWARRVSKVLKEDLGYEDVGKAISSYLKRGINGLHMLGNDLKETYRKRFGVEYLPTFMPFF